MACCCGQMFAATVTLTPVADTTLIETAPTNNLGGQYYANAGTTQSLKRNRGLFRFEPRDQIPIGSRITSAKLIFLVVGEPSETPSNPSQFNLHRVLSPWGEGNKIDVKGPDNGGLGAAATLDEATWISRMSLTTNTWSAPGGVLGVDFATQVSSSQFIYGVISPPYTFDSTTNMIADVQLWLDDTNANCGWMLKTQDESVGLTARRFGSHDNPGDAPQLVVDFIPAPTLQSVTIVSNQLQFSFVAEAGQNYTAQSAIALPSSNWITVTNISPLPATTNVTVSDPLSDLQKFYRVVAP